MSTRSTIVYGHQFHLFHEMLDDSCVYLELEGVQFEASYGSVAVRIPVHIWELIRKYPGVDLDLADESDADMLARVEKSVDDRISKYVAAEDGLKSFQSFIGSLVYGCADESREAQIAKGLAYFQERREYKQQVLAAIKSLGG